MPDGDRRGWIVGGERVSGDRYDAAFDALAESGMEIHGEADFVSSLKPKSVLDAGCGTGRVARELARRGIDVVGVDVDPEMLRVAQRRSPELEWHLNDLECLDLDRTFDVVVMAGNVMIFLQPSTESRVVAAMSRHLAPGGLLVAGFQLNHGLKVAEYDEHARACGLRLVERWSTWDRAPFGDGSAYAVSVHSR